MLYVNNDNIGNSCQNIWDQVELLNQLTLCNILNSFNDLGTPELRAAVAVETKEQKENMKFFLKCNTEELARLPDG